MASRLNRAILNSNQRVKSLQNTSVAECAIVLLQRGWVHLSVDYIGVLDTVEKHLGIKI